MVEIMSRKRSSSPPFNKFLVVLPPAKSWPFCSDSEGIMFNEQCESPEVHMKEFIQGSPVTKSISVAKHHVNITAFRLWRVKVSVIGTCRRVHYHLLLLLLSLDVIKKRMLKGQTIRGSYYVDLISKVREAIKKKLIVGNLSLSVLY